MLCDKKYIEKYTVSSALVHETCLVQNKPFTLNHEQKIAANTIRSRLEKFSTTLLFGVTGSGKTEVYMEAAAPLISQGRQVLILVPEINLTPQNLMRFKRRFAVPTVAISSRLSDKTRFDYWQAIKQGDIKIIIATRTGLLHEFADLGMIIVDEEHDSSFKQQSGICYHARDVAIMKAKVLNIPIVLGSATPSTESWYHAFVSGKYHALTLKQRALNQNPNAVRLINLQTQTIQNGISKALKDEIEVRLARNEQVLIFINRRGFAHRLICKSCGWCASCPHCDKPFTLHLHPQHLSCHFCGKGRAIYQSCSVCQSEDLIDIGSGTEKLEQSLATCFPKARITRLDRSLTQKKGALEARLKAISDQKSDIIIGTQMIAKGHDFQHVTLVGIINIDHGFYSQDFRSVEKLAQLVTQLAGRAGRSEKNGVVYVQSYQPENPLLHKILHCPYPEFLNELIEKRKLLNYPPFCHQAYLYATSVNQQQAEAGLQQLSGTLTTLVKQYQLAATVEGPIVALNEKKAGKYIMMLMINAASRKHLHQLICAIKPIIDREKNIKWLVDIDPVEMK